MNQRSAKVIGGTGRTLIVIGLLVILFAGFQLYGTGILEAQAQAELETEFDQRLQALEAAGLIVTDPADLGSSADLGSNTSDGAIDENDNPVVGDSEQNTNGGSDSNEIEAALDEYNSLPLGHPDGAEFAVTTLDPEELTSAQIALLTPEQGDALGRIEIPRINLERNLVEGVSRDDLRQGPGHYEDTPLPGQPGNSAIAGHRTTYGEPFGDLDLLEPGDLIKVTTVQGEHFYEVTPQVDEDGEEIGHFIVSPSETSVLRDFGDNRLTLTACHPKRSSRLRIIVTAQLVSPPSPVLPNVADETDAVAGELVGEVAGDSSQGGSADELAMDEENAVGVDDDALENSLGWNLEERQPTILWALAAAVLAIGAVVLSRFIRKWLAYLVLSPAFLIVLFFCFVHLDRLLPAL